jgi:predicted peptidase
MQRLLLPGLAVILSTTLSPPCFADQVETSFEKSVEKTLSLNYLLYLPESYAPGAEGRRWPLVVFLHGAGERGDDLSKVKIHGPPMLVEQGKSFPFILASPQCPEGEWWTEQPVLELIDHLEQTHRIDPQQIYLTGLSMGGYGTWHFATRAPERFAAIAPVCGGGVPYQMRWIKHLPVWAFHGDKDTAVPVEESTRLVTALKQQGNQNAKITVYPGVGHNSWSEAYNSGELYQWLLSFKRE